MKTNQIDNQHFSAINYKAVNRRLYERRLIGKDLVDFHTMLFEQRKNPFDIVLLKGKLGSLKAEIKSPEGEVVHKADENVINGILNKSPIEFITGLCEKANSLRTSSM